MLLVPIDSGPRRGDVPGGTIAFGRRSGRHEGREFQVESE